MAAIRFRRPFTSGATALHISETRIGWWAGYEITDVESKNSRSSRSRRTASFLPFGPVVDRLNVINRYLIGLQGASHVTDVA